MVLAGAVTGVGNAEAMASTALIAGAGDNDFGVDRDPFGIFISRKRLRPPAVYRQRAIFSCPCSDKSHAQESFDSPGHGDYRSHTI
jgi:hypothetical protein